MAESHKRTAKEPAVKAGAAPIVADAAPVKADAAPIVADAAPVKADAGTIRQALDELGIDKPYYTCRLVGNRLELTLYGGDVVTWPSQDATQPPPRKRRKR